ncbi:MAG: type II toxin-antitoxin system VapB family antitoxin [Synergistaceae bacterium]|jgi:antitoxin VapB|nr:type II toxin-antitoxin system VapB family antitoxin [Synergistaceae bacterium]
MTSPSEANRHQNSIFTSDFLRSPASKNAFGITNGKSQAVRLPKEYRFAGENVYIRKLGEVVYLFPKEAAWEVFMDGLYGFSDDFMAEGRDQGEEREREPL